jgi:hypothetical protein
MTDLLLGRNGLYHLFVTLPALLGWAWAFYVLWMRLSGWRLMWAYRHPLLPAEYKFKSKATRGEYRDGLSKEGD